MLFLMFGATCQVVAGADYPVHMSGPLIAYQPRGYAPETGDDRVSEQSIRADLRLLYRAGFRGLVTYSAQGILGRIPELARDEGFDGSIIMGVWNLESREEWQNALSQQPFVDGYCIGNEGLGVRYDAELLVAKIAEMKRASDRPITTTEAVESYLAGPYRQLLIENSDWLFPFAHPLWAGYADPEKAVQWTSLQHDYLAATTGKQVVLKEVGLPSAGEGDLTEERQLEFYRGLENTGIEFFYFEAFDQPWKLSEPGFTHVEEHWGLFDESGMPKKVARWLNSHAVE